MLEIFFVVSSHKADIRIFEPSAQPNVIRMSLSTLIQLEETNQIKQEYNARLKQVKLQCHTHLLNFRYT